MMGKLEKMIKDHSASMDVPETYRKRVEETLNDLPQDEGEGHKMKMVIFKKRAFQIAAIAAILVIFMLTVTNTTADANIFTTFRESIMDFLNIRGTDDAEKTGVKSVQEEQQAKPDLMIELQERVVDSSNIYLLVKITAPANIKFDEKTSFDYFVFSKGTNYDMNKTIAGATGCRLLEVKPDKENEATFVVQLSSDEKIKDGSDVTVYFKDLMEDPNGDGREMLVEGMWSVTFEAGYTVTNEIEIDGTKEMAFPFLEKQAYVKKVEITPLGMVLRTDISEVPSDIVGVSDTSMRVRLKMIDGSEILLMSHDPEENTAVNSATTFHSNKGEKMYQRNKFEFAKTLNVSQVLGLYIEDLYIPVKEMNEG